MTHGLGLPKRRMESIVPPSPEYLPSLVRSVVQGMPWKARLPGWDWCSGGLVQQTRRFSSCVFVILRVRVLLSPGESRSAPFRTLVVPATSPRAARVAPPAATSRAHS